MSTESSVDTFRCRLKKARDERLLGLEIYDSKISEEEARATCATSSLDFNLVLYWCGRAYTKEQNQTARTSYGA